MIIHCDNFATNKVMFSIEQIAEVCHEANRAYCKALGDTSQLPWSEAPEWQRKSACSGVEFHLKNFGASPSASHDEWLKTKQADGWKFGPVKDPTKKEHPCCVPFNQLSLEQQTKDLLFSRIVNALRHLV